jgi:hypothetical protein
MSAEEVERQGLMVGWERNCVYVKVEQGLLCVHDSLIADLHKHSHDLSDTPFQFSLFEPVEGDLLF